MIVQRAWLLLLVACGGSRTQTPAPPVVVATASAAPPVAPPPVVKPIPSSDSRCPPPPMGKVTDDETPQLRGMKPERVESFEWLEQHGVSETAAVNWYSAHYAHGIDASHAQSVLSQADCHSLAVGDKAEDALLCHHEIPSSLMQGYAVVLVVRGKKLSSVLDVGIGLRAMDFLDSRQLDLALAIASDGKSATLTERAPDGAVLIEAPSTCRERQKVLDGCEEALAKGTPPDPMCPISRDASGKQTLLREPHYSPMTMGYPATLHDCAGARALLREMDKNLSGLPAPMRNEGKGSIGFIETSCKALGRYVWKGDRFVREPK